MGFQSQCHDLTPRTQTHPLPVESRMSRSDFYRARLQCFLRVRHINVFSSWWRAPPPYYHPQSPFRATEANEAHSFLRGETCHSPQHYLSEGNGGRHGCQNGERLRWRARETCEVALGLQSRGPSAAWYIDFVYSILSCVCIPYGRICKIIHLHCVPAGNIRLRSGTILYVNCDVGLVNRFFCYLSFSVSA